MQHRWYHYQGQHHNQRQQHQHHDPHKRGLKPWHDASNRTWPRAHSVNNHHFQHDLSCYRCLIGSFSREEAHEKFQFFVPPNNLFHTLPRHMSHSLNRVPIWLPAASGLGNQTSHSQTKSRKSKTFDLGFLINLDRQGYCKIIHLSCHIYPSEPLIWATRGCKVS